MGPENRKHQHAGFAYLALLIAVAIIGIMGTSALLAGRTMARHAAENELLFIGGQFRLAFQAYYDATPMGQSRYPKRLGDLLQDPRLSPPRRYLRKIFTDPLTGKASWGLVLEPEGGIMGVYSLAEEKPIRVAGFPAEWVNLESKESYADWIFGRAVTSPSLQP